MLSVRLFAAAAVLAIGSSAFAQLTVDVVGIPGSGITTWTFSAPANGSTSFDATVRTNVEANFDASDTGQFPFGQDTILDTSIQDQVFLLTGTASLTVGGLTEPITGLFLDDDGGSADDFGVRVANDLG